MKWFNNYWKGAVIGFVLVLLMITSLFWLDIIKKLILQGLTFQIIILVLTIIFIIFLIYKKWLGKYWLLIFAGLFLSIYLMLTIVYLKMITPNFNLETLVMSLITALTTIILAIITYSYAKSTKSMAEEMKQQRYGNVLPIVDIKEQKETSSEMIKKGLDIGDGKIPEGQLCTLRNVGLGPAINVCSFIRTPSGERLQWNFGTLAVKDETIKEYLSIELSNERGILVNYYKDAYERPFESSREFIVNKENHSYKLGPLITHEITAEKYSKILIVT